MEIDITGVKEIGLEEDSTIGVMLDTIRRRKKLQIRVLAAASGISNAHVSNIMRGLTKPSWQATANLCQAMGVRMVISFEDLV